MTSASFDHVVVLPDPDAVAETAANHLVSALQANPGSATVCLTGGSGPQGLYALLATPPWKDRIPWDRTHWFIGDERFVPAWDLLNNMAVARKLLLDRCSPADNVHPIQTEGTPETAAWAYAQELQSFYGSATLDPARPLFDVVLMGVGPDGHTASLFPDAEASSERQRWVVGVGKANVAPLVPRVTLTLPVLTSCKMMMFLATGPGKRIILERLAAGEDLPAARAASQSHALWLIDEAAAPQKADRPFHAVIIMGVSGSGKSTIGKRLARLMGWDFLDGDDLHPTRNIEKMKRDEPLTDEDRRPWLAAIASTIDSRRTDQPALVVACSALKCAYRAILAGGRQDVRLVYLNGNHDLIARRLATRRGHFMPTTLLGNQFDALEPPTASEHAIVADVSGPLDDIVKQLAGQLCGTGGPSSSAGPQAFSRR